MTFRTGRFAATAAVVSGHEGVTLATLTPAQLVQMQRDLGDHRRAFDVLAAEVAGAVQAHAEASPGPGGIARGAGFRSPKQMIAETLGSSTGEAQKLLDAGKALLAADAGADDAAVGVAGPTLVGTTLVRRPRGRTSWQLRHFGTT